MATTRGREPVQAPQAPRPVASTGAPRAMEEGAVSRWAIEMLKWAESRGLAGGA